MINGRIESWPGTSGTQFVGRCRLGLLEFAPAAATIEIHLQFRPIARQMELCKLILFTGTVHLLVKSDLPFTFGAPMPGSGISMAFPESLPPL